jgi:hypothetical protein
MKSELVPIHYFTLNQTIRNNKTLVTTNKYASQ